MAKVLNIAQVSPSQNHPTGNAAMARFRDAMPAALLWLTDCVDLEEAPVTMAVGAAPVNRLKRNYRHAVPAYQSPGEYGQNFEDFKNAAGRLTL